MASLNSSSFFYVTKLSQCQFYCRVFSIILVLELRIYFNDETWGLKHEIESSYMKLCKIREIMIRETIENI